MSNLRPLVVSLALACIAGAGALAGCSVIAGVEFGDAHEAAAEAGLGTIDEEGGVAEVPDGSTAGCKPDQVVCNGACVSKSDPSYGCGATDCNPCSVPFGKGAACKDGTCAPAGCAAGREDCDKDPKNGCEADLTAPATCGACGTACTAAAPLCSSAGCVLACPPGTMQCGQSCIDTKTNIDHCGACGNKCVAPANGDPACLNSTCAFACRTGFGDCTNNPAKACNALPKWYQDQDGDKIGGPVSVQACVAPAGHVAVSGDCLDNNASVFPGQTAFFGTSFINGAGVESYDYDCSGVELEQFQDHWPGTCGGGCIGAGYTPKAPARAGAGVNNYCGSTIYRECIDDGNQIPLSIQPIALIGCRAYPNAAPAVPCH